MGLFQDAADREAGRTVWKKSLPRIPGKTPLARLGRLKAAVRELWREQMHAEPLPCESWTAERWWAEWFERMAERWLRSNRFDVWQAVRLEIQRKRQPALTAPYKDD